jgi:hypothetical protein
LNDGKSTDLVIRLEPRSNDASNVTAIITSNYVELELATRFTEAEQFDVHGFLSATEVSPTLAHFRGYVLEAYAHRSLTTEPNLKMKVQLLSLMGQKVQAPLGELQPALRISKIHVYQDLKFESNVEVDVYNRPKKKNEATIDSWAVVRRAFVQEHFPNDPRLQDASIEFFIVFFQITLSESHVVDGTILKRFIAFSKTKLGVKDLPVVFVFVTYYKGIRTMQNVTRPDKNRRRKAFDNQAQFGCQYAIRIQEKFQYLADKLELQRREMEVTTQEAFDAAQIIEEEE